MQKGEVAEPHPYLRVWLGCRAYSTPEHRLLPNAGGWLDQPAEMMRALDVCERAYSEEQAARKAFDEAQERLQRMRSQLLG